MTPFIAEFIGTGLLILLGNGVVANVVLNKTKGHDSGWIVITAGWGLAVFIGVFTISQFSGAHINPAVSIGLALAGKFSWVMVPGYILAQMLGAAAGTTLVWLHYRPYYQVTEDSEAIRATFCTSPGIRNLPYSFVAEVIGTFVLVFAVLYLAAPEVGLGALDALPVALVVFSIGLSLGGTTGYAINPARDLAPRLMHALLPIKHKSHSDWSYSWIPIAGPVIGAMIAAGAYLLLDGTVILTP
jgi:glycerol uptake facilitator protein